MLSAIRTRKMVKDFLTHNPFELFIEEILGKVKEIYFIPSLHNKGIVYPDFSSGKHIIKIRGKMPPEETLYALIEEMIHIHLNDCRQEVNFYYWCTEEGDDAHVFITEEARRLAREKPELLQYILQLAKQKGIPVKGISTYIFF